MILDVINPSFNEENNIVSCIESVNLSCRCAGLGNGKFISGYGCSCDSTIELAEGLALENLQTSNEKKF